MPARVTQAQIERFLRGCRKALASLLSERGMSDAQIGAILAHTNAQTTAIYTAARNRRVLAAAALSALPDKIGDW